MGSLTRSAARQRARHALRQADTLRLYHGTCSSRLPSIRQQGLTIQAGVKPMATPDSLRATGYALRACCVDLIDRGLTDPAKAKPPAVLTLHVPAEEVKVDTHGDYVLDHCPRSYIRQIKVRPELLAALPRNPADLRDYAHRAGLARAVERNHQDSRVARHVA